MLYALDCYIVAFYFQLHCHFVYLKIRRQARLRREYIYRKSIEDRERTILEKKQRLKNALEGIT